MSGYARNPKNAPGPFYVINGECLACCAPQAEAPGLVTDCDGDGGCYFRRQPESPEEVDAAIRALVVSCIEIYRYGGQDDEIRRRLAEVGMARLCDSPLPNHPEVFRNHVRFTYAHDGAANGLADLLVQHLAACIGADSGCTVAPTGGSERASFEFNHSMTYGRSIRYELSKLDGDAWLLVRAESGHFIWLDELLRLFGARDLRWYSEEEWMMGTSGRRLPY